MKKYLIYLYLGLMFACLFGANSVPQAYQKAAVVFGFFLFGLLLVAGVFDIWRRKTALRGRGLHIEFSNLPIIYVSWLALGFAFGMAAMTFAILFTISHGLGVVLPPWLNWID